MWVLWDDLYNKVVGSNETEGVCDADIYTASVDDKNSPVWCGLNTRSDYSIRWIPDE